MLEADMSSSVRVPSSRLGTALSIATIEPLHHSTLLLQYPPDRVLRMKVHYLEVELMHQGMSACTSMPIVPQHRS